MFMINGDIEIKKHKKVKILYGLEHVIIYIRCWKVNESKIFEYDNNHYN